MKSVRDVQGFADSQGTSRQAIKHRIDAGWRFGYVDGKFSMFNPKSVKEVKGDYVKYLR
jgi:hypothetical protein